MPLYLAGLTYQERRKRIGTCLDLVDARDLTAKMPDELSGGQAQRVAVARVLAQQPRLILADEPTGQLDHAIASRVLEALLVAADHLGAALVITTHDARISDLMSTCWGMRDGRLATPMALAARG
jgi:putative ABC transport system ATP-binding protein